jgi:hypothetical protein
LPAGSHLKADLGMCREALASTGWWLLTPFVGGPEQTAHSETIAINSR